ncbi:MAG: M17 family peptidase N-terminal domain-containing protein, partial [Pseudomonadota bacterium]
MAYSLQISFDAPEPAALTATEGVILALWRPGADGAAALSPSAAACDAESGGQVARALRGVKGERGDATVLLAPHGLAAEALILLCAGAAPLDRAGARRLGAAAAKALAAQKTRAATVRLDGVDGSGSDADAEAGAPLSAAELAAEALLGLELRGYRFETYKSEPSEGALERLSVGGAAGLEAAHAPLAGLVAGSVMTRDLVNEPANTLTPPEFAARAKSALEPLGVAVEILDEAKLAELGMRALLAVGQGSRQPS